MFSLSDLQLKSDLDPEIVVCKTKFPGHDVTVGCYKISGLRCIFKKLVENFEMRSPGNNFDSCANQPSIETVKELVQLLNQKGKPSGSLHYTLRLTCFGPTISTGRGIDFKNVPKQAKGPEAICLDGKHGQPLRCHSESGSKKDPEFDEFAAQVNGNELIVRIHKQSKHLVTRVFDSDMTHDGKQKKLDKNVVSIHGCDQQIDFKFPGQFDTCGDCKMKPLGCGQDSKLTEFQRLTSCVGTSFKNSCCLPVVRGNFPISKFPKQALIVFVSTGNLKYPGRIDDASLKFDLFDKCNPREVTDKYKKMPSTSRGACVQVDGDNLKRELQGKCKLPKGIEVCQKGCTDDSDVFILKIGRKRTKKVRLKISFTFICID